MRGIILAGGSGSRLGALTKVTSKQLLPVYDKPVIYYPLCTLMQAGITDILIISTPRDTPRLRELLLDGDQWGVRINYAMQARPGGIAEAFLIGEPFIGRMPVALILGDNLFYGADMGYFLKGAVRDVTVAKIFAKRVDNPEEYGVVEIGDDGRAISLEEKPKEPRSNWAVTGLYVYDGDVVDVARSIKPSARGELEITDVNKVYLTRRALEVVELKDSVSWIDVGTPDGLLNASNLVRCMERLTDERIGCPATVARKEGLG